FAHDAAADVVAGQELGRPPRRLVPLGVAPAFFLVVGGLRAIVLRNLVEHEAAAVAVLQDAALASHAFGDENASHARRPDHAGRMELDELHVHQLRASLVGERVAVAGVLPAFARDLVGPADAAGREHDRLRAKHLESPALALVRERARYAIAVLQQTRHRALHVHVDALMNSVILQRPDHLEAGAIADVRETRI